MQRPQRTLQQNHKSNHCSETLIRKWRFNARTTSNASSSPLDGRDVTVERRTRMNGDIGVVKVGQNETINHTRKQNIFRRVNLIQTMTYRQPQQYMSYTWHEGDKGHIHQKETITQGRSLLSSRTETVASFNNEPKHLMEKRREPFESQSTIELDKQVL